MGNAITNAPPADAVVTLRSGDFSRLKLIVGVASRVAVGSRLRSVAARAGDLLMTDDCGSIAIGELDLVSDVE
jgi:hypothetical protein